MRSLLKYYETNNCSAGLLAAGFVEKNKDHSSWKNYETKGVIDKKGEVTSSKDSSR